MVWKKKSIETVPRGSKKVTSKKVKAKKVVKKAVKSKKEPVNKVVEAKKDKKGVAKTPAKAEEVKNAKIPT